MSTLRYPQRIQSVHVESIDGELCVYDTAHLRVHSLNHTAAFVWQRCDGRTAPAELAATLSAEASIDDAEAVVRLTLHELAAAQLLAEPIYEVAQVSRRELLRRGVAATALPAIFSIVAPAPAAAQSVPSGGQVSFAFTGADDTFVVPAGVVAITIVATGGQGGLGLVEGVGGSGGGGKGGLGGRTEATVSVTPAASLTVRVGSVGPNGFSAISTPGGFNGGGGSLADGGGGGGASSVRHGATPLVVAGGGGGGGAAKGLIESGGNGGAGGGLNANSGQALVGAGPGGGGGQITGGIGGFKATGTAIPGTDGTADQGGVGGEDFGFVGGGGGGGGHFGGGGGGGGSQSNDVGGGGGGGGSSFTAPGATGVVHQQGVNSGNGSVTISW